ncbi:MAG: UDP-glucose/GDP-mannose dehydrogenase family protein [Candidatus Latescibacteria bacterium]|nr:UDP-glucose/GDP-mannose dehydrogenase family protein [Candidatus Latescibacterota bacterium]
MNITIIGSGYVGLVTGACFADLGNRVLCVDNDVEKVRKLQSGVIPIYEPGLEELVGANVHEGRLAFSASIADGVTFAEVIFISVGTPPLPSGEPDLSAIERVSRVVAEAMTDYRLIVEKSTVPVQTGEWVERTIREHNIHRVDFDVASNPEFLREGSAIRDFLHPDRVVIGVSSDRAAHLMVKLYAPLNAPLLITDINSAELIKHASNAFLALKISYINAIATVCERTGADIVKVAKGIGLDRRIGLEFLNAGIGYGGSCFPKDLAAFVHLAERVGYDFDLLRAVARINDDQRQNVIVKLEVELGLLRGKIIGILGLAFKTNTDDMRGAPSIEIIQQLIKRGATVRAYDPVAMGNAKRLLPEIEYRKGPYEVADGADALVIVTEWNEFRHLNLPHLRGVMRTPVLIDGRNIYDPVRMKQIGFRYRGVGR